jgi:outer membrane protein with beta-barrel domain
MSRLSRGVLLIAVLTVSAVVLSTMPASAQTREGLLLGGQTSVADTGNTAFLTAGMAGQAPPPPGGSGPRAEGFGIGAKIGPLWSSFDSATVGSSTVNFDTSTGWEGGIWFGGNRGGRVGVMGEVLYAKKKQQVSGQTGSSTSLKYLEIPILLRVNIGSRSRNGISIYGLVGPVFDVNLKAEANGIDVKKGYESLDIGLLGGVGIEITRFLVEGRYNHGLRNVLKSTNAASATDIKTHSFAVLFGLRFN